MNPQDLVFIAGHRGMAGSAIVRCLLAGGHPADRLVLRARGELDLCDGAAVRAFLADARPDRIYLAAARVGGIHANDTYPADFITDNLRIELNVIAEAFRAGVKKLLFLGSSCIYPRLSAQPITEEALLGGPLEPTNEAYAVAKIAGIKLCESFNRQYAVSHGIDYRSVMPTNLYGPGDNYVQENSHVIPALIRRFHEAKQAGASQVTVWGSGKPRRDFLHVDDMARACVHVMNLPRAAYDAQTAPMRSFLNVGSGSDVSIAELAQTVARVVGFEGEVQFDATRPDGMPRKLLDCRRIHSLGWRASMPLAEGLALTYRDFLQGLGAGTRL